MILKFNWDKWQQQVLDYDGNITLRTGRQVGKSEVVSEKAKKFAKEHKGVVIMVIAASQRQSSLLFEKIHANIANDPDMDFLEKPTLTRILLTNGSKIYCLPTGRTGHFIRGFTIDLLIADEAAYIPETVWLAVTPMLAVSRKMRKKGHIILLSTPFGKGGYFYNSFYDKDFKAFHVSSEDCPRIPKDFLRKEQRRMTKAQYRQEYLGEFTDEWSQFFPTNVIKNSMTFMSWSKEKDYNPAARYYLGVDFARYGGDENAYVICELYKCRLKIVKIFTNERVSTTDPIGRIQIMDKNWKFSKIFVDSGGLGGPILDLLTEKLGRKVFGLDNATRRIEIQGQEKKRGILKEDLYSNALMLMETGLLTLIDDLDLARSLKSISFEYTADKKLRIYGKYSHITEAMVRSTWCLKERGLSLYVY